MPIQRTALNFNRNGTPLSLTLDLDDQQFSQRLMLDHFQNNVIYEPETARIFEQILQPGDTFLDIGGHVGFFSMFAAMLVGPTGRVFTFEPEASNFQHLLHHIAINNFHHVFPLPWAVGHSSAVTELFINLDNDGGHAFWNPGLNSNNVKSGKTVTKRNVFAVALDDLFRGSAPGAIKLIKIDTEGNETHVLKGARQLLSNASVPAIIAEVNRFGLNNLQSSEVELREYMASLNYTSYALHMPLPVRFEPSQTLNTPYVFNLLFASPQMQKAVQNVWPQSVEEAAKRFAPSENPTDQPTAKSPDQPPAVQSPSADPVCELAEPPEVEPDPQPKSGDSSS
jgi:FkbM family methyltransferase